VQSVFASWNDLRKTRFFLYFFLFFFLVTSRFFFFLLQSQLHRARVFWCFRYDDYRTLGFASIQSRSGSDPRTDQSHLQARMLRFLRHSGDAFFPSYSSGNDELLFIPASSKSFDCSNLFFLLGV